MTSQKRPDDLPKVLEELEQFIAGGDASDLQADDLEAGLDDDPGPPPDGVQAERRILTDRRRRR